MPIEGLTNRPPAFPQIGTLRKGDEKKGNRPGKDLSYFRFTSEIEEVQAAFETAYDGEPRLINCLLPFDRIDPDPEGNDGHVWDAWQEEYVAGGLVHRCNGKYVVLQRNGDGQYERPAPDTVPCPGKCKPNGRLKIVIPEFKRLAYVMVLTTSKHDVTNLDSQLRALKSLKPDFRGVPLQLRRRKTKIRKQMPDGKRIWGDSWLLSIEAAPTWAELQLAAQEAAAIPQLPEPDAPAVPEGAVVVNGTTGEVLGAGDNGPDWDDVPDQDEESAEEPVTDDFVPPPDFLLAEIPMGKYAGKTTGEMLELDFNYLQWVSTSAKDMDIRLCAKAAIEWQKETQPELF